MRLGYVYAYDRCEGRYFRSYYNNFGEVPPKPDTDVLAYECFRHAAEAGIAEGCYKLGDMLAEGRGCAADHAKALDMFLRAYMCDGYCGRHIYTKYMIEEDDTMDEVAKAGSSASKT